MDRVWCGEQAGEHPVEASVRTVQSRNQRLVEINAEEGLPDLRNGIEHEFEESTDLVGEFILGLRLLEGVLVQDDSRHFHQINECLGRQRDDIPVVVRVALSKQVTLCAPQAWFCRIHECPMSDVL